MFSFMANVFVAIGSIAHGVLLYKRMPHGGICKCFSNCFAAPHKVSYLLGSRERSKVTKHPVINRTVPHFKNCPRKGITLVRMFKCPLF